MSENRVIVFDTETTGFSVDKGDRMVEFAGVVIEDGVITDESLQLYINPQRQMPKSSEKIHGLSTEFLSNYPVFSAQASKIKDFLLSADKIIAHNLNFDLNFLIGEFAFLGAGEADFLRSLKTEDTLLLARSKYSGMKNNLDDLCRRLNISLEDRKAHGALIDSILTAKVYLQLTRAKPVTLDIYNNEQLQEEPDAINGLDPNICISVSKRDLELDRNYFNS